MYANRTSDKYTEFEHHMLWYIAVIEPLIQSLWSLKAAHANASDVFVFWLAAGATLNDLFNKEAKETGLPHSLVDKITGIYNSRYEEFFESNGIYFVTFILDPCMLLAPLSFPMTCHI